MRDVRGQIAEERAVPVVPDELDQGVGEDLGAVAFIRLRLAVVLEYRIPVAVAGRSRRLADAAAPMHQGLVEPLVHRAQRVVVPEVPLAEDSRDVPVGRKQLGERLGLRRHQRATEIGVHHAGPVAVPPRQERCARRSAFGLDVELGELGALGGHAVERGCADMGIAVKADLRPALVVGHDQDDVRLAGQRLDRRKAAARNQQGKCDKNGRDRGRPTSQRHDRWEHSPCPCLLSNMGPRCRPGCRISSSSGGILAERMDFPGSSREALIPVRLGAGDRTASDSVTWRDRFMWRTAFRRPRHQGASTVRLDGLATLGTGSKESAGSCCTMSTW